MWAITLVAAIGLAGAQVKPLRNTAASPRAAAISLESVDFQDLRWGHEGPGYVSTRRPPRRGAREMAEARVFGQEAIALVRFELIDEAGRLLGIAPAIRTASGVDDGEYSLRVEVPSQPFRFRIAGQDPGGQPFARVYRQLFLPGDQAPSPLQFPAGFTPDQSRQLQALMDSTARQQDQMFEAALRASADGWVRIPRTQVVEAGYEPLRAGADAIGLRVHAAVRFSAPGMYSVRPHVFPAYARYDWRGAVTMNVVDARVDPAPQNTAADSLHDVIRYGGAAQYEGGVLYRFTFDMIPSYVIRNAAGTRYCLYLEQFRAAGNLPRWSAIVGDGAPVRYSIDFSNLGFTSLTEPAFPQRTFYESFRTGGAPDCGPNPNVNF